MKDARATAQTVSSAQGEYDRLRYVSGETPCPYLPGRLSRCEAYFVEQLDGAAYEHLMGRRFRRSGRIVYRTQCRGCSACQPLRVPVADFRPTRSMRRVWRRNADLRVEIGEPSATVDKFTIFRRYLEAQHDEVMSRTYESFAAFLYDTPLPTQEFRYHLGGRLAGVSLADRCPGGLSSVYMFFDPELGERSLGTYSILWEIEYCKCERLPYYYLGYYVAGSETMSYKSRFRPNEVLAGVGRWRPLADVEPLSG